MGCVSSKVVTRSGSFHEQLGLSLCRRTAVEDLVCTKNDGDQLLALICTANIVTEKLKEQENDIDIDQPPPPKPNGPQDQPDETEVIDAVELMSDLEEEEIEDDGQKHDKQSEADLKLSIEDIHVDSRISIAGVHSGECISCTNSFHTVEEYDALVSGDCSIEHEDAVKETKWNVELWLRESCGGSPTVSSMNTSDRASGEKPGSKIDCDEQPDSDSSTEIKEIDSVVELRRPSASEIDSLEKNVSETRISTNEKGLRRKAMARELKTLKPPSFEFSSIGSLREWLGVGGQVASLGSYATPKFGNIGEKVSESKGEARDEGNIFEPELVADFEVAIEMLTMEEEHILKQISGGLEDHKGKIVELNYVKNTW